jgi:hypothetical protein
MHELHRKQLDAGAFFSTQLLIKVIRNLIASGAYDASAAITNIQEALEETDGILGHEYREVLTQVAGIYEAAVQDVVRQLGEGKTRGS